MLLIQLCWFSSSVKKVFMIYKFWAVIQLFLFMWKWNFMDLTSLTPAEVPFSYKKQGMDRQLKHWILHKISIFQKIIISLKSQELFTDQRSAHLLAHLEFVRWDLSKNQGISAEVEGIVTTHDSIFSFKKIWSWAIEPLGTAYKVDKLQMKALFISEVACEHWQVLLRFCCTYWYVWWYVETYWYVSTWYVFKLWHVLVCIIFGMYYMYW